MIARLVIGQVIALVIVVDVLAGSFTAQVDKTIGTIEDQFILTLTVNGQADDKPRLPEIVGLDSSSAGTSHSTSWVNGVISREVQYRYLLTASRLGKFTIPSIELVVDGKSYATLPIVIEIQKQGQQVSGQAKDLFIVRQFSQDTAYVGEQVIETIKLYRHQRVKLLQANRVDDKKSVDLATFPLGKERNYRQNYQGHNYLVTELRQAIVPLRSGQLQVSRFILDTVVSLGRRGGRGGGFFDDFFSSARQQRRRVVSEPFTLTVKPLPAIPAKVVNLEIVGDFRVNLLVSDRRLTTGNSATLTITVAGRGNLQGMESPQLTKFAGIKVYPDKPQIDTEYDWQQGLVSRAIFKYALLPTSAGNYDLGKLRLAHFNPSSRRFEVSDLKLGIIEVEGDEEQVVVAGNSGQQQVQVIGSDLSTIHRGKNLLNDHSWSLDNWWQLLVIVIGGLVCYSLLFSYLKFFYRRKTARRSRAYRLFKEAQQALLGSASLLNVTAVDRNFRTYLGDKFGLRGLATTTAEMGDKITVKVADSSLCQRIVEHLQELDKIVFAGRDDRDDIRITTEQLVKEIEKKC